MSLVMCGCLNGCDHVLMKTHPRVQDVYSQKPRPPVLQKKRDSICFFSFKEWVCGIFRQMDIALGICPRSTYIYPSNPNKAHHETPELLSKHTVVLQPARMVPGQFDVLDLRKHKCATFKKKKKLEHGSISTDFRSRAGHRKKVVCLACRITMSHESGASRERDRDSLIRVRAFWLPHPCWL